MKTKDNGLGFLTAMGMLENSKIAEDNKIAKAFAELNRVRDASLITKRKIGEFSLQLPAVVDALSKAGLYIATMSCNKTGDIEWKADDSLRIGMSAKPLNPEKFRWVRDEGYTKSGSGRNQDKLNGRAGKLEEMIKSCGIEHVSVNPYSFEIRRNGDESNKSILIEMWVK